MCRRTGATALLQDLLRGIAELGYGPAEAGHYRNSAGTPVVSGFSRTRALVLAEEAIRIDPASASLRQAATELQRAADATDPAVRSKALACGVGGRRDGGPARARRRAARVACRRAGAQRRVRGCDRQARKAGTMTRLLRLVAFAIAIAGVVDPAITLSGASRARVAVVALRSAPPAADGVRERLVRDLSASYEIVPQLTSDAAAAIVIGDRYPDRSDWPGGAAQLFVLCRTRCRSRRSRRRDRRARRAHRPRRRAARRSTGDGDSPRRRDRGTRRRRPDDRCDRRRSRASRSAARRTDGRQTTSGGTRASTRFRSAIRRTSFGSG